jgi:hypothetical protein
VTEDELESILNAAINDGSISFSPVEVTYDEAWEYCSWLYGNFEQR